MNKKTNSFGKSDETACQHVFLSAAVVAGVALKGEVVTLKK